MKSRFSNCIAGTTLLVALAIPVPRPAQEAQRGAEVSNVDTGTANPVPLINEPLVPDARTPGGAGFTLTVNGTGFVSGCVVKWNGGPRVTHFVSRSQLTARILSSDIAKPSTARVTVVNGGPGGGTSNVVFFEVTTPTSSISLGTLELSAGSDPFSVAVGDLNGDGKLDLAAANNGSDNVSVLLGRGDGTFQAAADYSAGSAPQSVAVGDFNGDGRLDLVVANNGSDNVSVLLGRGDGTFQAAVNYGAGSLPDSVAVGDFNGEGKLDLVVANASSNNVSVLLGNGDGTFQAAVDYGAGSNPSSVAVGDFNGDGKLDLAVANSASHEVSVFLGNGDGTFQAAGDYSVGSAPRSVAVGDFTGDGKLDLVVANASSNNVSVLLGNGDGTFQAAVNYGAGSDPDSVAVGDFNGDGKLDLAVANFLSNNISVLLGNGNGTFQAAVEYPQTAAANESLAVGDFNGDGRLDIAVAGNPTVLLQGTASLSEKSLKFTDQVVGTSTAAQAVKLTNIGSLAVSISSVAVTGANASDFSQTNACDSGLPAGASCVISVTFKPTRIGPRNAAVTITDNSAGSPQSVALSGTGVASGPDAALSRTSLTFVTELVGTTSPAQSLTLSNYGTATLNITSIGFTGADPSDFHQTSTCGSSVAPGASCTISMTIKPTGINTRTAKLLISDNAPGSPQTVSLSGTGTVVELVPTNLGFVCGPFGYRQSCVCTPPKTTTLTNVGSTPLDITGIAISGSSTFSQTNTCNTSVAAGNSCAITVTWSHATECSRFSPCRGEISVSDNGGASPQTVSLTGVKLCTP